MTLGEKVKALREARGWSQAELARRARVRQALLSELESGRKEDTTGSVLRRLARALYISVDYLLSTYNGTVDPNVCPEEGRSLDGTTPLPVTTLQEEHGCEEYSTPSTHLDILSPQAEKGGKEIPLS